MTLRYALALCVTVASVANAQLPCPSFDNPVSLGNVANSSLSEISGIAASRLNKDILWAHDDSGDSARVFAVGLNGAHRGVFSFGGVTAIDWEDMALGPGPVAGVDYLYASDTGNNSLSRSQVTIYRVREPNLGDFPSPASATLSGVDALPIRYADGNRDVETLLVDPLTRDIVLLTRDRSVTGTTYIYSFPAAAQIPGVVYTVQLVGEIQSTVEIKGGDVSPDGLWVLLRRHSTTSPANGWLYQRNPAAPLHEALATAPCLVPMAFEPQGEAVAFRPDMAGYYTISEGAAQPVYLYIAQAAPIAPTNGDAIATSADTIQLTWTDMAINETGYRLERSIDGITFEELAVLAANAGSHGDSGLAVNTVYTYRVSAFNLYGYSEPVILQATTTLLPPVAPSNGTSATVSESAISISWSDNANNESGYRVERSQDGVNFLEIALLGANSTTFNDSGLVSATSYSYRIYAYNDAGDSGALSIQAATANPPPVIPAAPMNLAAQAQKGAIHLTWTDNSSNESGFKIEQSTDGRRFTQLTVLPANASAHTVTGLNSKKKYYFRLRAYNAAGDSAYSNTASAQPLK